MKIGKAVVVKNESEFNSMKVYLGEKDLYVGWVPQMAEKETAIIVKSKKKKQFSVGSSAYLNSLGLKVISFEEYITM